MYIVYSVLPHFMESRKLGPCLPRQIGYATNETTAKDMARTSQGFHRNIND